MKALTTKQLDEFVNDYFVCVLFAESVGDPDNEDEFIEILDSEFSVEDFTERSRELATQDCSEFITKAVALGLDINVVDMTQVAYDFWFTRRGHGVGFWDRPEIYGEEMSQKLTELCDKIGDNRELCLYGDNKLELV